VSQACVASHKWTSGVLTFQEKDSKFHAVNFTGKPSRVEKLIRIFTEVATVTFRYCLYHIIFCTNMLNLKLSARGEMGGRFLK